MDDNLNFLSDINKFSDKSYRKIVIDNGELNLNLKSYSNKEIFEVIDNWKTCLEILNKSDVLEEKEFMKIVYSLLSDVHIVDDINGCQNRIDLYHMDLNCFINFETVNKRRRTVKLKSYIICDTIIVIDCKNPSLCSIYEI